MLEVFLMLVISALFGINICRIVIVPSLITRVFLDWANFIVSRTWDVRIFIDVCNIQLTVGGIGRFGIHLIRHVVVSVWR